MQTDIILRSYENKEVLANLKTNSKNNVACSHFFNIGLNTINFRRITTPHKILWDFLSVSLVSFHLKGNITRLLSLQTECTSYLTSCQTTWWENKKTLVKHESMCTQ